MFQYFRRLVSNPLYLRCLRILLDMYKLNININININNITYLVSSLCNICICYGSVIELYIYCFVYIIIHCSIHLNDTLFDAALTNKYTDYNSNESSSSILQCFAQKFSNLKLLKILINDNEDVNVFLFCKHLKTVINKNETKVEINFHMNYLNCYI